MKTEKNSFSITIFELLGLDFLTLKLCNAIDWSWVWVLAPFWIPWVLALLIFIFLGKGKNNENR